MLLARMLMLGTRMLMLLAYEVDFRSSGVDTFGGNIGSFRGTNGFLGRMEQPKKWRRRKWSTPLFRLKQNFAVVASRIVFAIEALSFGATFRHG